MNKRKIKVDVVSDVVCPWCYIGKRRLEAAIRQVSDHVEVEVRHLPFELNPDLPAEGTDQKQHLRNKFGGEDRYRQLTGHVTSVAGTEGLKFNFEKQHVLPNTLDAHRLIQLAAGSDVQGQLVEAFMKAYFEDGVDLSNRETLIAVAASAGLDANTARQLLQLNNDVQQILDLENMNYRRGISGVPFFIINDKYGVSGAQPAATLAQVFADVSKEVVDTGEYCATDDPNC